jgi:hypothetical protein
MNKKNIMLSIIIAVRIVTILITFTLYEGKKLKFILLNNYHTPAILLDSIILNSMIAMP